MYNTMQYNITQDILLLVVVSLSKHTGMGGTQRPSSPHVVVDSEGISLLPSSQVSCSTVPGI